VVALLGTHGGAGYCAKAPGGQSPDTTSALVTASLTQPNGSGAFGSPPGPISKFGWLSSFYVGTHRPNRTHQVAVAHLDLRNQTFLAELLCVFL
jgi:hypothetical protein